MTQLSMLAGDDAPAVFSPCRTWRYTLRRRWSPGGRVCAFIGLNPSTADEVQDDPTIRRCIGFAKRWGFDEYVMLNLFGYRATDPKVMMRAADPIGPHNDRWIARVIREAEFIVCAWGAHGSYLDRARDVRAMLAADSVRKRVHHLGLTAGLEPRHPLYLRGDSRPTRLFAW